MKETEEMERQMAVRASEGTVRKEKKNELTELPLKMTIKAQDSNYIFEIVGNKNTSRTHLFFLIHHFYVYTRAVKRE